MTLYTTNYNLDKYEGSDKPNLRDQYNSAMDKIDSTLKTQEDNKTELNEKIDNNKADIENKLKETKEEIEAVHEADILKIKKEHEIIRAIATIPAVQSLQENEFSTYTTFGFDNVPGINRDDYVILNIRAYYDINNETSRQLFVNIANQNSTKMPFRSVIQICRTPQEVKKNSQIDNIFGGLRLAVDLIHKNAIRTIS